MTAFPHIKRLGLEIFWEGEYVRASDLEKLLEQAPVAELYEWRYGDKVMWRTPNLGDPDGTHTALLVGVKPIERPEDAKANDLFHLACQLFDLNPRPEGRENFIKHAKKLLGDK